MTTFRAFLPILLILAAPAVLLYPLWSRPVSAGEDDVLYYYPARTLVGRSLGEGNWPLSTGGANGGAPLMGDPQSAVMYPPTWLFAVLRPRPAYALSILLAFWLAGVGMFAYLRRLEVSATAAVFGSVAFMFCGFMVGHRVHLGMIHTAAALPWGLWAVEGLRRRPAAAFAAMVPILFLAVTSGHWPTLIHLSLVWTAYLLVRTRPLGRSLLAAGAAVLLAAAMAAPQLGATFDLFAQATRQRIGYGTFGENSFFPLAAVLAFFPFLMGSRTPNFFSQEWWGSWHLCEMLGYVGLATLVLAGAAVWRLYRNPPGGSDLSDPRAARLRPMVRLWTWLGAGAGVWMLGYYLPTYRLIHLLPVLGNVRCPSRMVLTLDAALAVLAALAVHVLTTDPAADSEKLAGTVRRATGRTLPAVMAAALALTAGAAGLAQFIWGGWPPGLEFFAGGPAEVWRALAPTNPAVWVPVLTLIATIVMLRFWLKSPRRRAAALPVLLLADLFFPARFVDAPPPGRAVDPDASPAAAWLRGRHSDAVDFRVWGLGRDYFERPAELLLPMTCYSLGFETIAAYGPLQSPAHAHLFGFRPWGLTRDWPRLLRTNRLLSLYNVRYVLAAGEEFRSVIESVRVAAEEDGRADGPDVLTGSWAFRRGSEKGGVMHLRAPAMWLPSGAEQPVALTPGGLYRIALDIRGPDGGAANFIRADIHREFDDGGYDNDDAFALIVEADQTGEDWRHFEWTFEAPPDERAGTTAFRVFTLSERPVEVRNVSLRPSQLPVPAGVNGRLSPGQAVYKKVAELPALREGDAPVTIYENILCRSMPMVTASPADIEILKWSSGEPTAVPDVRLKADRVSPAALTALLGCVSAPAALLYIAMAGFCFVRAKKSGIRSRTANLAGPET